jgi:hypothetical protein
MKILLYAVIALLMLVWAIEYLTYHAGKRIFMFLLIALVSAFTASVGSEQKK